METVIRIFIVQLLARTQNAAPLGGLTTLPEPAAATIAKLFRK